MVGRSEWKRQEISPLFSVYRYPKLSVHKLVVP